MAVKKTVDIYSTQSSRRQRIASEAKELMAAALGNIASKRWEEKKD